MHLSTGSSSRERGFSLIELLIALLITLVLTGGALVAFKDTVRLSQTSQLRVDLNENVRVGLDLLVRDFIQVGDGLPNGKILPVPNGGAATAINRPGPNAATFPVGTTDLTAVIPGDEIGPVVEGNKTDMITVFFEDTTFEDPATHEARPCTISADGRTVTFAKAVTGIADPLKAGDLLMLKSKTGGTAIQMVTKFESNMVADFEVNDPMNINQSDAPGGSVTQLNPSPGNPFDAEAHRLRMTTYWIEKDAPTGRLQMMRQINFRTPQRVAMGVEQLQFSYDLVDGITNPSGDPNPATPSQIRKINIFFSARSSRTLPATGQYMGSTMATQVALRSLALVDRYQ